MNIPHLNFHIFCFICLQKYLYLIIFNFILNTRIFVAVMFYVFKVEFIFNRRILHLLQQTEAIIKKTEILPADHVTYKFILYSEEGCRSGRTKNQEIQKS